MKKPTWRKVLRWTLRIVLGSVALAILLVAIAIGAIHTQWGRERIRREIEAQLQDDFPGSTVGRVDGSPFGTLTATGIALAGKDGKPFVTIESAELGVQIKPLLGRTVHVDTITLSGVLVDLAAQPDAKSKKPDPMAPQPAAKDDKPSSWDVEVPHIIVRNARVLTKVGERLDGIDVDAGVRLHNGTLIATGAIKADFRGQPFMAAASVSFGPSAEAKSGLDVPYAQVKLGPADITVIGGHVVLDGSLAADGTILANVPASLAKQLGVKAELPGDIAFGVHANRGNVSLDAIAGPTHVRAFAHLDLSKLDLAKTDFTKLDDIKATGDVLAFVDDPRGRASVALSGSPAGARGVVTADAAYVLALDDGSLVDLKGGALVAFDVQRSGAAWNLVSALVSTKAATKLAMVPAPPSAPKVGPCGVPIKTAAKPVAGAAPKLASTKRGKPILGGGSMTTSAVVHGTLSPVLALDTESVVDATNLAYDDSKVDHVHVRVEAKNVTGDPTASAHVEVDAVKSGTFVLPSAELDATAALHADGSIDVDLGQHHIVTADGRTWTGRGGHVAVTEHTITAKDLQTGTGNSTATASATVGRDSDDISAKAKVKNVSLAMIDPTLKGIVGGDVSVTQKCGSYTGSGSFDGKGIVVPGKPVLDGHVGFSLAGRRVKLDANATTVAGGGHVAVELEGPRDIKDPEAWKRLERSALKNLTVGIDHVDLSRLGLTDPKDPKAKPVTGVIDGEITLAATDAGGTVHVGGIATSAGAIETTLSLKPAANDMIAMHVDAALAGVKPATIDATFALPAHPFDPDAWAVLGNGALQHATVRADHMPFDKALLARLGVEQDVAGTVDATVEVEKGLAAATVALDVTHVTGPQLRAPVDVHVEAAIDGKGTAGKASAKMGGVGVTVDAKSPLTIADAMLGKAQTAALDVTLTIPKTKATQVLALLGRQDLTDGTVGGTVKVGGTVAKPSVVANLTASNLTPPPSIAAKKPAKLEQLDIAARWTGNHAELEVTGFETGGKLLKISGRGDLDKPQSVAATIEAAGFDIAPVVAFAPGALGAARGTLDGVIKVNGLDPQTGDVRGKLHLTEGRVPLAPTLGTVRKADVEITIAKQDVKAVISAKLGAGSITGTANATLAGGMPKVADFTLALRKLSPIGAVQPVIDADVSGKFAFADDKVMGKINIRKGKVYVPPEEGDALLDTGAPADMFYVGPNGVIIPKPVRKQAEKPWLFADIDITTTSVYVDDPNFLFDGTASGQLHLEVGQGLTLEGALSTEKGAVDVLGRRYQIDHAIIDFDGSLDPRLDIRIFHDFKNLTLTVDIGGTSLVPDPRLKGDPAGYTQGQLFAFLAGAEPGDDSSGQAGQAVTGAASALLSSRIGRKVNKYLPFKLDTLNYEAGTPSSSGAVRAGVRLSDSAHLLWRQRLEARPDENPGEAVLEYVIRPWALLEATGGERASGGDILLRKRW